MVKTYKHGYKKIKYVIKGQFINDLSNWKNCIYKYNDLYLTGTHSILVDKLDNITLEKYKKLQIKKIKLEDKYLLIAGLSNLFIKIENNNKYIFYNLVLESDNINKNYGIYANNVLCETLSIKKYLEFNFK